MPLTRRRVALPAVSVISAAPQYTSAPFAVRRTLKVASVPAARPAGVDTVTEAPWASTQIRPRRRVSPWALTRTAVLRSSRIQPPSSRARVARPWAAVATSAPSSTRRSDLAVRRLEERGGV